MSGAALTVKVEAINRTREEGEEVRYKRCSQAQPVRLMAKAKRLEETLETVEANDRKMKASYLESFDIKKMREFYAVIDGGERIKAKEAFQAISKENKFEYTEIKLKEDEAREKAQGKDMAEKAKSEEKEEAKVAAEKKGYDEDVALEK